MSKVKSQTSVQHNPCKHGFCIHLALKFMSEANKVKVYSPNATGIFTLCTLPDNVCHCTTTT